MLAHTSSGPHVALADAPTKGSGRPHRTRDSGRSAARLAGRPGGRGRRSLQEDARPALRGEFVSSHSHLSFVLSPKGP